MRQLKLTLIWIFCFLSINLFAQLDPGEYQEIKQVALEIIKSCPPSECFYIGLGRSPTAIIAFFESVGIKDQIQFPLSDFRYLPPSHSPYYPPFKEKYGNFSPLPKNYKSKLDNHFSEWLPDKAKLGNKKIMLIDFSVSGESLMSSMSYIEDFYRSQGVKNSVQVTTITESVYHEAAKLNIQAIRPDTHFIKLKSGTALERKLLLQKHDQYSKYGQFRLRDSEFFAPENVNPKFEIFKKSITQEMANDATVEFELEASQIKIKCGNILTKH